MNYEESIEFYKEKLREKSTEELLKNIENIYYQEKINNLKQRNPDLDFSSIEEKIKSKDPIAIALLRKDPTKQNASEKAFFEYVGLEKLPQSGPGVIKFGNSKAADFKVGDWYGTQKYIKEAGGAQDNQINDAILFAKEALKLGHKVIICIDGEYGRKAIRERLTETPDCIITTADELKRDIENGRYN